ncbi:MAG: neutral/alkaline non-lysosomal ceramidase N-terminal domain-containing protein [Planctomycetota bacterium]
MKQRRPGDPVRVPVGPPTWRHLAFPWPAGSLAPTAGIDPDLFRFVDLDRDGNDDLIASTHQGSFVSLFDSTRDGWSTPILNVSGDDSRTLPPIVNADGSDNGFLVHSAYLAWQNENTDHLPDLVHKVSIDDLLAEHRRREARLKLPPVPVGAAKIDITPDYTIRLSGYGSRMTESEGVAHRIHARALAIGGDSSRRGAETRRKGTNADRELSTTASLREKTPLTVFLSVDTCGVPADVTERVFARIAIETPLRREHFAVSSTHTHSAPWLMGFAPNLFAEVPDEHRATMQKYENELVEKLVQVAQQAIGQRRPGRLSVGFGRVDFATNRRTLENGKWTGFGVVPDGPVDRRLPVLAAHDTNGKLITVLANYACHCTTETGSFNQISGDWAGFAAEHIEEQHPDAVALIAIGAGADANPEPRGTHELSKQHGQTLGAEVHRLLSQAGALQPLDPLITGRMARVDLPLGPLPTREEWEQRAQEGGTRGSHAQRFLGMLDRGEDVPTTIPDYPVQTWCFGEDLAMVFLGGEVVVDYALRMSDTFDSDRLWLNAYSNAMPSYIASKRVLQEGGYEADFSMIYYARPTRLAPETEDIIVDTVQKLLPQEFYSEATQQDFPAPKTPEESAACIQVKPGLKVELVAAEPLITDPVAFDWDIQGRLWVVEMGDYPGVEDRNGETTNGRIRVLTDVDSDGRYDEAQTFLDGIGFPTGICRWRNGVLITAAPEIIYAEDTDGDGRADVRKTLYRGFNEGNQQHRVNGLQWGLDGWIHVGNGDSGGSITAVGDNPAPAIAVSGRDLRIRPDTRALEATSGQTQFGRSRDDWGNWFGNNNSNPIWHYVLDERYIRRNRNVPVRSTRATIAEVPGAAPVFPISRTLARFNDFARANHFTSACSTTIYRDNLLGEEFYGDAFVCEPVHNLVSRLVLKPDGVTFKAARSPNEQDSEFFASSDNWTRPVMVRTGPDGALWVADMYRFVIEHPQWIPAEQQRKLNLYAGSDRGRIYRIVRETNTACCGGTEPDATESNADLRSPLSDEWNEVPLNQLVKRIASPNGWWRDTAQRILNHRQERRSFESLTAMARRNASPLARLQALCTLDGIGGLTRELLIDALNDAHPGVRRHAIRLSEPLANEHPALASALFERVDDNDATVAMQLARSLGELKNDSAGTQLARLMERHQDDQWLMSAALSSLNVDNVVAALDHVLAANRDDTASPEVVSQLIGQAAAFDKLRINPTHLANLLPSDTEDATPQQWQTAAAILVQLRRAQTARKQLEADPDIQNHVNRAIQSAVKVALADDTPEPTRLAAIEFAGETGQLQPAHVEQLATLITPQRSIEIQSAAAQAISLSPQKSATDTLLSGWKTYSPVVRSQVAMSLLRQRPSTERLLAALEDKTIAVADLDASLRERLLTHPDQGIQKRVSRLFNDGNVSSTRQSVVESLRTALESTADIARGRTVFEKRCASCHKLGDLGKSIGADLAALKNRSSEVLLTAILDPNRAVEAKFLSYIAVTNDGRTFSGMMLSETGNSITLIGTDGKEQTLLRADLEELIATNRSLMPEGLEKDLAPQDLADVIAFVQSFGAKWKSFPGNEPRLITAADDHTLILPASAAEIYGPSLILEEKYGNLGWWSSTDDYAVWTIETKQSGFYRVELEYACDDSTSGGAIRFSTGTRLLTARVAGTGTWDNYRTWSAGAIDLRRGRQQLTVSALAKPPHALIDLKAIRLIPVE